jgi:hypothetical protein
MGNHQPASVEHTYELLKILQRYSLRCELGLEIFFDLLEASLTIQHVQDGKFFVMESKVVEPHRFFHNPIGSAMIAMPTRFQVRATTQPERSHRAVDQRISHRRHKLTSSGKGITAS